MGIGFFRFFPGWVCIMWKMKYNRLVCVSFCVVEKIRDMFHWYSSLFEVCSSCLLLKHESFPVVSW